MIEDRQTIEEKTARLESAKEKVKQFVDSGGDLKSPEALPLGVEFIEAYDDLAKEFGYEILKPIEKEETTESQTELQNTEALLNLFDFDKKRELEQYCRQIVIDSTPSPISYLRVNSSNFRSCIRFTIRTTCPSTSI